MAQTSFVVTLKDRRSTQDLGYRLGLYCLPGTVLLLSGSLGSGKTTLVQGLGRGLGIVEPISSPTFTLINEYLEGRIPLYHVDLYRLEPAQVESLELTSYWDAKERRLGVVAIEWAERMMDYLPMAITIVLKSVPGEGRQATLEAATDAQIALLRKVIGDGLLANEI